MPIPMFEWKQKWKNSTRLAFEFECIYVLLLYLSRNRRQWSLAEENTRNNEQTCFQPMLAIYGFCKKATCTPRQNKTPQHSIMDGRSPLFFCTVACRGPFGTGKTLLFLHNNGLLQFNPGTKSHWFSFSFNTCSSFFISWFISNV